MNIVEVRQRPLSHTFVVAKIKDDEFSFMLSVNEGGIPNSHISFDPEHGLYIYLCINKDLRLTYDEINLWRWHHGAIAPDPFALAEVKRGFDL